MDRIRRLLPCPKRRDRKHRYEEEEKGSNYFIKNGSLLLEDLISIFGPRYNLPIRSFSLEELIRATKDFSEKLGSSCPGDFFAGSLGGRRILVKHYRKWTFEVSYFIRDIVITSQMSHHKNVLHLAGCCLELKYPAMVFDFPLGYEFIADLFNASRNEDDGKGKLLSWRNRIKIAKDISSVLMYLHSAFATPIILRGLKVSQVVIDRSGVAKLFGFGLSISLPPGEFKVEDKVTGTAGYIDPEYMESSFVTEKTDVYSLGVFILALFAGRTSGIIKTGDGCDFQIPIQGYVSVPDYVKSCIANNEFIRCIDPKILEEEGQNEETIQHLLACAILALRCTEEEGVDRPEMIDVARQLCQAEKSTRFKHNVT